MFESCLYKKTAHMGRMSILGEKKTTAEWEGVGELTWIEGLIGADGTVFPPLARIDG